MLQTTRTRSTVVLEPQSSTIQFCSSSRPGANQQLFSLWLPGPCVSGAGTWSGAELLLVMHWISPHCALFMSFIIMQNQFSFVSVLSLCSEVNGSFHQKKKKRERNAERRRRGRYAILLSESKQSFSSPSEWLLERDTLMGRCVVQSQMIHLCFF